MFALEVEYLMGRVVSSRHDDRKAVEWPPHPTRLFSALVAAHKECGLGDDALSALEWMESLPSPEISAQPCLDKKFRRDVHDVFVPVNDKVSVPERRSRQLRWFPAFIPEEPTVVFIWPAADPLGHYNALQSLAENVTYLGHSMSPVRVAIALEPPQSTLVPDPNGDLLLRVPSPGRLAHLEHTHELRLKNSAIQPRLGRVAHYAVVSAKEVTTHKQSIFRQSIIFRKVSGETIPLDYAAPLSLAVRAALMSLAQNPLPEVLSGHDVDGNSTRNPHIAIAPLASIEHRHADGHLMGFAVLIPKDLTSSDQNVIEEAVFKLQNIKLGKIGAWEVEPVFDASTAAFSLRFCSLYNRPSKVWASVTPVIFGHFPDRNERKQLKVISGMCADIGLPAPVEVRIEPVCAFKGINKAMDFSRPKQGHGRFVAHVWLRFDEPVLGPVLLGAGRFVGLGLCRPVGSSKRGLHDHQ